MRLRSAAALAALPLLAACSEPPGQVALGVRDAYARLSAATELPDFIFDRQCGILVHVKAEGDADRSVTWRVLSSGQEMLSFTATLTAVDPRHTKIALAVSPAGDGHEAYDGTQTYRRPPLRQPTRPAIEEQVFALLEGRPYDPSRIPSGPADSVCNVQRAGLESGTFRFSVNDRPGMDAFQSERARRDGVR